MQPIAFFYEPLYTVPHYAVANFFADRYAQEVFLLMIFRYIHDKISVGPGGTNTVYFLELSVLS